MTATPWVADALCAEIDPDLFMPEKGAKGREDTRAAIAVCRQCPVSAQCLEYALTNGIAYGIWGAHSAQDRDRLRERGAA